VIATTSCSCLPAYSFMRYIYLYICIYSAVTEYPCIWQGLGNSLAGAQPSWMDPLFTDLQALKRMPSVGSAPMLLVGSGCRMPWMDRPCFSPRPRPQIPAIQKRKPPSVNSALLPVRQTILDIARTISMLTLQDFSVIETCGTVHSYSAVAAYF
jgi:hypothetical protein